MDAQGFVLLIFVAGIVGTVVWLRRRRTKVLRARMASSVPKVRAFMERTGYVFDDARGLPPDGQAKRWEQAYLASVAGDGYRVHLVRNYQGLELHWQHLTVRQDRTFVWSQDWWAPLAAQPRVLLHISERSNTQPSRSHMTSTWQPAYPRPIVTGDAAFDGRFVVFGLDEHAVRAVLANPTLRQALLACAYVDLRVQPDAVRFSDPKERNATAAMGGPAAANKYSAAPGAQFELTLPVHEHVAHLLLGAASLTR